MAHDNQSARRRAFLRELLAAGAARTGWGSSGYPFRDWRRLHHYFGLARRRTRLRAGSSGKTTARSKSLKTLR